MNGYDPNFLGKNFKIDIPSFNSEIDSDILKNENLRDDYIADYCHYSVVMSKKNRQAYLSICNLDQTKYKKVNGRNWFLDDKQIGRENQLGNEYYKCNVWDRGHLTRRTAVTWGDNDFIAKKASNDSCCYANACLQHENFNQDEWRIPEDEAHKCKRDLNGKISIITGPLFTECDKWLTFKGSNLKPARIPSGFWKIIYYIDGKKKKLGCEAYLIYQDDLSIQDRRGRKNIDIKTIQVSISEITDLTGIEFSEKLYNANPLWYHTEGRAIEEPEQYEIKVDGKSENVKEGWTGHVIHDRDDIKKHGFKRVSK